MGAADAPEISDGPPADLLPLRLPPTFTFTTWSSTTNCVAATEHWHPLAVGPPIARHADRLPIARRTCLPDQIPQLQVPYHIPARCNARSAQCRSPLLGGRPGHVGIPMTHPKPTTLLSILSTAKNAAATYYEGSSTASGTPSPNINLLTPLLLGTHEGLCPTHYPYFS